ncbi:sulfite reductase [Novosphingobium endophyticum]|uniref:Sulfite reductase n=1 Tax=Novosphingobium endophyticum TaxID=1955250 RepID=A0A916X4Q6_9SPHN|nr:flavodoxin domain-containing protein [Novosphingobium endophyticum]GGB94737.1 sulfite reductase [Novosphingobium endophyticum]
MSSNNPSIGIFVATITGLADICGEEIEDALANAGLASERHMMDCMGASDLDPFDLLVIVSSTYGHGDIPDNGQALYGDLENGADLSGKKYVLFALGDRTYADTFCAAGDRWATALDTCGATRIVDIQRHDASSGTLAEDVAGEWAASWIDRIKEGAE